MRPGEKCAECGAESIRKPEGWTTRYICPNGCDAKRLAKLRSENASKFHAARRQGKLK